MRRLALGLVLALAACGGKGYRDKGAGMSSTTRFDLARMAGDWRVVARFADAEAAEARAPERFRFDGATVTHVTTGGAQSLPVAVTGPGRMRVGGRALWVLWVDDGFRTAAIGHPSGAYGWIMEQGAGRADQRQAAREILAWAGYDLTRLVEVTP